MEKDKYFPITSMALAGYRGFGNDLQVFSRFSRVNLLIGQNNSGKSNFLSFLSYVYPQTFLPKSIQLNALDAHLPEGKRLTFGLSTRLNLDVSRKDEALAKKLCSGMHNKDPPVAGAYAVQVLAKRAELTGLEDAWFLFDEKNELLTDGWEDAFRALNDRELNILWQALTGRSGGARRDWWLESLKAMRPRTAPVRVVLIPAFRKIGSQGTQSEGFNGDGIIERLVRLQNPGVLSWQERRKFDAINRFLRNVTSNNSAKIEIPHEKDTINVHMDDKFLPLESLGTGIHEVIILAAAATILENVVICMEEPELHLNPILQRKLVRYLISDTNNQFFISTHSAALMDTPGAEIYHLKIKDGASLVERVTSDRHRSSICEDLGYHPSDVLQANCVIWVEGPSDRLYLKAWVAEIDNSLVEGIHYSVMFYGGRLSSHVSGEDLDEITEDLISLRRLNRRGVVIIDSDRSKSGQRINSTKKRLKDEFDRGPGFAWVTQGREVENYLPATQVQEAITATLPSAKVNSTFGEFENVLSIVRKNGNVDQAPKVDVARYIVKKYKPDLNRLDLLTRVRQLVRFIHDSNPALHTLND